MPGGVAGNLGVGDYDAVILRGGLRVRVGELGVEGNAVPCGGLRPLDLEVLGGDDDGDRLDGALGEEFGDDPQGEGGLTGPGGVATARKKSRGLAARYLTNARRCQPRNAWVLGASTARTPGTPLGRDGL